MPLDHAAAETPRTTVRSTPAPSAQRLGGATPRPLGAATPASLLHLQRAAGNAAVQHLVQREETPPGDAAPPTTSPGPGPAGGGAVTGDGSGPTTINGALVDVNAGAVNLHAPVVTADGVIRASTIIADNVVASSYTPGAGNIW